ncbi:MAG: hypothetical protein ACI857_000740 [Arenicella sp.]|jgi:hypothetical protein
MKYLTRILFITSVVLFSISSYSQRDLPASDEISCSIIIKNITVIPVHLDQVYENQDVVITCGEISTIEPHIQDSSSNQIPEGYANTIDGTGKFLVAAYSDAHVHLPAEEELEQFFILNLLNGVTSMRSMRGEDWHLNIDKNSRYTPRLYLSAPPIVDSSFEDLKLLETNLKLYKRQGWDFLKLLSIDTSAHYVTLQRMALAAQMKVAGHCPDGVSLEQISQIGNFMSVEHLGGISDLADLNAIVKAIKLSNKSNIYHCPTINWAHSFQFTNEELRKLEGTKYVSKSMIAAWEDELEEGSKARSETEQVQFREMVKRHSSMMLTYLEFVYQQGGKLLISPDASAAYNVPGFSYHDEIQHYKGIKMSNREILRVASYNMAEMFGESEEWGTVRVGAKSDLLILNSNPLDDIKNAQDIDAVILKGQYIHSGTLRSKLLHP